MDGNTVTALGVVKVRQMRDMHLLNLFERGDDPIDSDTIRQGLKIWDIQSDEPLHQGGHNVYSLRNGRQLFDEPGAGSMEMWSRMQLLLALSTAGWDLEEVVTPKAASPHLRGGNKTFYMKVDGDGVFAVYLRCLLNVDMLFGKGLTSLHHGQIKAYYSAVEGLSYEYLRAHGLPPEKSAKFYHALLKGTSLPEVEDDGLGLPSDASSGEGEATPVPRRSVSDVWMRPRMTATLLAITMRCDTIRYDTMRCDTIRYDSNRYDTIRYDSIRREMIRYDTKRCE